MGVQVPPAGPGDSMKVDTVAELIAQLVILTHGINPADTLVTDGNSDLGLYVCLLNNAVVINSDNAVVISSGSH